MCRTWYCSRVLPSFNPYCCWTFKTLLTFREVSMPRTEFCRQVWLLTVTIFSFDFQGENFREKTFTTINSGCSRSHSIWWLRWFTTKIYTLWPNYSLYPDPATTTLIYNVSSRLAFPTSRSVAGKNARNWASCSAMWPRWARLFRLFFIRMIYFFVVISFVF